MVDLSIMCGNDFTSSYAHYLRRKIGLGGHFSLSDVAAWVKENGKVENHPAMASEIVSGLKYELSTGTFCLYA